MWDVSARWDSAVRVAHEVVVVAEIWRDGVRQTLPDGSTSLSVTGGSVTVDESSNVRRSCSVTLSNVELSPVLATDLLSPFGTDIRIYQGVRYTQGDTELVPVIHARIGNAGQTNYLAPVSITADDYSKVMQDARFLAPWTTPAGNLVTTEIRNMVLDAAPLTTVIDLTGSTAKTSAASWDRDRWNAILKLSDSIGADTYFDPLGRLIIRPTPLVTAASAAVWTVDAGSSTAVMTDVATALSSDRVYNAVVASSSQPGVVASALAYQQSGAFAYSKFKRPRFYSSPFLSTIGQCQSAAAAILARGVAFARQISPTAAPNPALEVGDVITVVMPANTAGVVITEKRIVSKVRIPLGPGPMSLETRVGIDAGFASDVGTLI